MKVYKHKPQSVKASEIRYTRPDGSNAVVPIDWGEYDYLYNELDKVMGHDFTEQLREALEGYDAIPVIEYHTDGYSEFTDAFEEKCDEAEGLLDKLEDLDLPEEAQDIVNYLRDAIGDLDYNGNEMASIITSLREDLGMKTIKY